MSDGTEYYVLSEDEIEDAEGSEASPNMSPDEVRSLLALAADEAFAWREEHLDPFITRATEYYRGDPFGNEEKDRSQIVITTVRDAWRQTMPSLMRVFFGPERVVEFMPREAEDVAIAEQQTDVVNVVVREDNPGFLEFKSWFDDAGLRRLGTMKYWWEDTEEVVIEEFEAITLAELSALLTEYEAEQGVDYAVESEPVGVHPETDEEVYDVRITVTVFDGRVRFAAVPPEEMIWSPSGRTKMDSRIVGHVREVPADFIVSLGHDPEVIEEHAGRTRRPQNEDPDSVRRVDGGAAGRGGVVGRDQQDPATLPTLYGEIYMRVDVDGDGIAELRCFEVVGDDYEILNGDGYGEPVDEIPFSFLTYDPEAHAFVGLSQADSTMQYQAIKSFVARGVLDSLANAIDPVTVVDSSKVNMKDVLSRALSRIIRSKTSDPNSYRPVDHRWVGGEALPLFGYLDSQVEDAVGRSKAAQGLDPDVMQSTTKAAVQATVSGGQQQLEWTARIFAETGVKDLYKGILRLLVAHGSETKRRVIRLRNEYVEVDPNKWDATLDVRVNVALGMGLTEEKVAQLDAALEQQMVLLQAGAPFVNWQVIRKTLARRMELAGWANSNDFFLPWDTQQQQQFEQAQAEQEPQQDPAVLLAEIEQRRVDYEAAKAEGELALKREEMMRKDDLERDKASIDAAVQMEKIRAEFGSKIGTAAIKADTEVYRTAVSAEEAERSRATAAPDLPTPLPEQVPQEPGQGLPGGVPPLSEDGAEEI